MSFTHYGLRPELIAALEQLQFIQPTEIQAEAIPFLLDNPGQDFIGLAQTGTGKTAAFGLPLLQRSSSDSPVPRGLILSPTRELCLQITAELKSFARNLPRLGITAVYGGANISEQIRELRKGSQIVVATPGRLADLIRREKIDISQVADLVLDEADIMLHMGFKEELDQILEAAPGDKRVILLSATMPPEVARIAATYMHDPHEVRIGNPNTSIAAIDHRYVMVHSKDKYQALKRLLDIHPDIYGIVFSRTKVNAQHLADQLIRDGYNSAALHGDLSQVQRDQVMQKFRDASVQILVATDVAARGLDVDNLSHVIHYDLPDEPENYIHRSGRTGRAGRSGSSIAIINLKEKNRIRLIERKIQGKIVPMRVPDGRDICEKQLIHLIDRVHAVEVDEEQIASYLPVIEEKLAALDRDELLKHFVSLEFNRFLEYYRHARDINPVDDTRTGRQERGTAPDIRTRTRSAAVSTGKSGFDWIRINLGRGDRLLPPQIIGLINESTQVRSIEIGKIIIEEDHTSVMIEASYTDVVLEALQGFDYRGRRIQADLQTRQPSAQSRSSQDYQSRSQNRSGKGSYGRSPGDSRRGSGDSYYKGGRRSEGKSAGSSAGKPARSSRKANDGSYSGSRKSGDGGYTGPRKGKKG